MRTNIELDAELVREAQALSGIRTKRALIHQALTEFVNQMPAVSGRIVYPPDNTTEHGQPR